MPNTSPASTKQQYGDDKRAAMSKKRRIAIVMPLAHQQGGAESLLLHLLQHGSTQYEFVCIFLQEGPLVDKVRSWGHSSLVYSTTRLTDPVNYVSTLIWLRKCFRREKVEAVLSWMLKAHFYVSVAAIGLRVKTLWFQHGIPQGGKLDRLATALPVDLILCCSQASQDRQNGVRPKRKTAVCYPGVVFPTPAPLVRKEAREQLQLDVQANIIGMVARLERWKGAHILIEAAEIVSRILPGTYFFIVGGDHPRDLAYAESIRQMAVQSRLEGHLILAGQRPAAEVPLWQASADIIVHPVTGEEPFGMAIAEAMGMERVVIASDRGGPREIIQAGENGFLVPRGDAAALAAELIRLLQNPGELRRIEPRAFERGRSFSVSTFVNRVNELLTEALS